MQKAPCYKCENRAVGCHTNCQKYAEYRAELESIKEVSKFKNDALDYTIKAIQRRKALRNEKNRT